MVKIEDNHTNLAHSHFIKMWSKLSVWDLHLWQRRSNVMLRL